MWPKPLASGLGEMLATAGRVWKIRVFGAGLQFFRCRSRKGPGTGRSGSYWPRVVQAPSFTSLISMATGIWVWPFSSKVVMPSTPS